MKLFPVGKGAPPTLISYRRRKQSHSEFLDYFPYKFVCNKICLKKYSSMMGLASQNVVECTATQALQYAGYNRLRQLYPFSTKLVFR